MLPFQAITLTFTVSLNGDMLPFQAITLTFTVSLNGDMLPFQAITLTFTVSLNGDMLPFQAITLTFSVSLNGDMLPFQAIYGGKPKQSLQKMTFPHGFSLRVNEKHYSNTDEVLKHLEEIVIPYVESERERLGKPDQPALLIWDVFKGQMGDSVTNVLREN